MSRLVTSLCALPSFGASGTPVLMGGTSGSTDAGSPIDVTDLPRATATPGGTIPAVGQPGRAPFFAQLKNASRFDSYASVYALPVHVNSPKFSLSFWLGFEVDDVLQGAVYRFGTWGPDDRDYEYFDIYFQDNKLQFGAFRLKDSGTTIDLSFSGGFDMSGVLTAFDPIGLMQGWAHVMLSVDCSALTAVAAVNDTVLSFTGSGFTTAGSIGFSLADQVDQDTGEPGHRAIFSNPIGTVIQNGKDVNPGWEPAGFATEGCVTEFWAACGQYLDWSSGGTRGLFHDADLAGLSWSPVDLGKDGATPTGTKPTMYYTGGPSVFAINRATGRAGAVRHDSAGGGGFENVLPACDGAVPT